MQPLGPILSSNLRRSPWLSPAVLVAGGSQLQEHRSQCPYYDWRASEVEGAAGPSRQPPETQRAGCVWVALSPPLSNVMAASSGFLLTFPTLSFSCVSHGLTQRAGRVSLLVTDFVTQAQSGSNPPMSPTFAWAGILMGRQHL